MNALMFIYATVFVLTNIRTISMVCFTNVTDSLNLLVIHVLCEWVISLPFYVGYIM